MSLPCPCSRYENDQSTDSYIVDWDTIESHHKFMNSADYGPAITNLGALIDGQPTIIHADFVDNGARRIAFSAPVTELVRVYMKSQSSSMEGNAQKLFEVLNEHAPGFVGGVSGWVVEDVEHEKLGPGVKGKVFAAAVGWQSVDAHMNFRETEQFKSNIHLLTDEATAVDMHHVKLMQPEGVEPPRPDDDPRIGGLGDKDIGQQTTM